MTAVSHTVFDDLVGEPCLECGDGQLEQTTIDGTSVLVCDACNQKRGTLWEVDQ